MILGKDIHPTITQNRRNKLNRKLTVKILLAICTKSFFLSAKNLVNTKGKRFQNE